MNFNNITRRNILKYVGAVGLAGSFSGLGNLAEAMSSRSQLNGLASRPNFILIVTDDQGYGDLSCQPHTLDISTPNIDRLAQMGVRMTDGYSCAPICSPSRLGMLTGRYPQRLGYYDNWEAQVGLEASEKIAPSYFKKLGYKTAAIGKWHLGWQKYNHPLKKDFDYHFGFNGGMHDYFEAGNGETWEGGAI